MTSVNTVTGEVVERLTAMERSALVHEEATIEQGADQVAKALAVIRDRRLYREDYSTFDGYCRERWGMTHRRVNQQIAAVEVNEIVGTIGSQISERAARELADLRDDPEQLRETYQRVHDETGGNVTAAAIRQHRAPSNPPHATSGEEVTPQGEDSGPSTPASPLPTSEGVAAHPTPRPAAPVIGIDGKRYSRPEPKPAPVRAAPDEWTEQDRAEELAGSLASHLSLLFALTVPERREEYIANWRRGTENRPVLGQKYVNPDTMRQIADGIHDLADEWEQSDAV